MLSMSPSPGGREECRGATPCPRVFLHTVPTSRCQHSGDIWHYSVTIGALVGALDTFTIAQAPSSYQIFWVSPPPPSPPLPSPPRWASRHKRMATDATIFDMASTADEGLIELPSCGRLGLAWFRHARRSCPHGRHDHYFPLLFPPLCRSRVPPLPPTLLLLHLTLARLF